MPVGLITGHGMGSPDKPANDSLRAQRKLTESMGLRIKSEGRKGGA